MSIYKLTDAVQRFEDADNTAPAQTFHVGGSITTAVQIIASASATGVVAIGGSLQYAHDPAIQFPIFHEEAVSDSSKHIIWFADMPMQTMQIDVSGLTSGDVSIWTGTVER